MRPSGLFFRAWSGGYLGLCWLSHNGPAYEMLNEANWKVAAYVLVTQTHNYTALKPAACHLNTVTIPKLYILRFALVSVRAVINIQVEEGSCLPRHHFMLGMSTPLFSNGITFCNTISSVIKGRIACGSDI